MACPRPPSGAAWGLLTPTHWQVGREQIVLRDPAALELDEAESRALLQAVRELFESRGLGAALGRAVALVCHA